MGNLRKFNEFYYGGEESMEKTPIDSNLYQLTKEEMDKLQKLSKGQISEVKINGFTISMPSEFDGKAFLVANEEGKHQKISFEGGYPAMAEAERKVLDIISGKSILESKRNRRHR
jgi:hypothetical protein